MESGNNPDFGNPWPWSTDQVAVVASVVDAIPVEQMLGLARGDVGMAIGQLMRRTVSTHSEKLLTTFGRVVVSTAGIPTDGLISSMSNQQFSRFADALTGPAIAVLTLRREVAQYASCALEQVDVAPPAISGYASWAVTEQAVEVFTRLGVGRPAMDYLEEADEAWAAAVAEHVVWGLRNRRAATSQRTGAALHELLTIRRAKDLSNYPNPARLPMESDHRDRKASS